MYTKLKKKHSLFFSKRFWNGQKLKRQKIFFCQKESIILIFAHTLFIIRKERTLTGFSKNRVKIEYTHLLSFITEFNTENNNFFPFYALVLKDSIAETHAHTNKYVLDVGINK